MIAPARGGCALNDPITPELAENNEQYAILCALGWNGRHSIKPCPVPLLPTWDASRTHAQGTVVSAIVPQGIDAATAVRWEVAAGQEITTLYFHRSTEGIPPEGLPPGSSVTFGAPGLEPTKDNYVRVTFEDSNGDPICWSAWETVYTPSFAVIPPDPPGGTTPRVEDPFDRPDTSQRCWYESGQGPQLGDGLGPDAVWTGHSLNDDSLCPQVKNGAGYFGQATGGRYAMTTAQSIDVSYAEALVSVDMETGDPGSKYNFQVQTKVTDPAFYACDEVNATVVRGYWAKLVFGPRLCDEPTLFLLRAPEQYAVATCTDSTGDGTNDAPSVPDQAQVCDNSGPGKMIPPLDLPDPQDPTRSRAAWLRVLAKPVQGTRNVEVRGWIAWDCADKNGDGTVDIDTECTNCKLEWTDTYDPSQGNCQPITGVSGRWGFGGHERDYYVDIFRAGDDGPPNP